MKKKVLVTFMMVLSLAVLSACGKSEKEKIADELEKEYGMSKEEADLAADLVQGLAGESSEEGGDDKAAELSPEEQRMASFQLVEPKNEIVNSKLSDQFVQVEDALIYTDGSVTAGKLIDTLNGCYDFPVSALVKAADGKETEASADTLVIKGTTYGGWMKVNDDLGNIILQAYYLVSDTDGPVKLYDMPIRLIQSGISLYSLNFFAPGYICPASYKIESKYMDTEAYKTRVSQCPALKYDEIEGYIENQGLKYTLVGNDKASTKYISGDAFSDGGKNYYIETECYINIDMETATADEFGYILTFNKEDSIRYNYTRLEDFEESDLEIIKEEGKNGVLAATKSSATSAEIVGYISHSLGIEFVYRTDNDEYVKTNMCTAHKTYGGEFTYKFTPMIGAKAYSSVDELLEGNFISKDDYVSVVD